MKPRYRRRADQSHRTSCSISVSQAMGQRIALEANARGWKKAEVLYAALSDVIGQREARR